MDLLEYVRDYREELVLKPNRGYGGTGVHLGRGAVAERMGSAARRGARRAARSAPAVGRAGGRDAARASLPRARRAGPHARGAVLRRHGFRADGSRPRHHRARLAEAGRQRRAARRPRGRARRLSARGSQELDALARAGRISRRRSCVRPCSDCAISTASFICSSGTRRRIGRAAPPRIAPRSSPCSVRCGTSSWPATGSAICWRRSRRAPDLTARERMEIERLGRLRRAAVALPQSLVAAFAETRSHCLAAWEEARRDERLRGVPESVRAAAQAHARAGGGAAACRDDLYDGLLDEHEPGMRRARLDPLLQATGARLRALVPELAERTRRVRSIAAARRLPPGAAAAVLRRAAARHGLRLRARPARPLDASVHDDGRRRRRARHDSLERRRSAARDLRDAARRRPRALRPRAAARAARHAARRRAEHGRARVAGAALGESRRAQRRVLAPLLRAAAGARSPTRSAASMRAAFTARSTSSRPASNRVAADEATYNLHVLVRYELEIALLDGDLARRRPAGRLGRALPALPRRQRHAAARRLPAGRALGARRVRLLPDLHDRQPLRGAARRRVRRRATTSTPSSRAAT